jgi:hypothetical protein
MANPPESLSLAELDTRFSDSIRDTTLSQTQRYRYLKDAYSLLWYSQFWEFRKAVGSVTVSAGVTQYPLADDVDLVRYIQNTTTKESLHTDKSQGEIWSEEKDHAATGNPDRVADIRSQNGNSVLVVSPEPTALDGDGQVLNYYYFKHIIHNDSTGATVTGNLSASTDVPSLAPQFHILITKLALLTALKDKRQFADVYTTALREIKDLTSAMKARYLTPQRGIRRVRVYRGAGR